MPLLRALLPLAFAVGCTPPAAPPDAPSIVLLSIESLRTDHVGAYGGGSPTRPDRAVTPVLDAFAAEATVYEDAHSVTSWTLAAHASLFTGLYPSGHQTDGPRDRLDDSYPTLAETLSRRGYQTAGFASGPYLRRTHNLHQGFELWDDSAASLTSNLAHDDVTNPALERAMERFLEEQRDPARPFFLFAYFWDPHYDFLPPPPYRGMFMGPESEPIDASGFDTNPAIHPGIRPQQLAYIQALYAGELRATDAAVGRLFERLRQEGLWDDTLVIVTADHGEEFFDHGEKGHKNNLYAETVKVPLIIKYPGQREGRRDARLVSLVDVFPTVLELAGGPVDFPLHGVSLLGPARGGRAIYHELLATRWLRGPDDEPVERRSRWYAVREGRLKLVWRDGEDGGPRYQLFDVEADPREQHDLLEDDPEDARRAVLLRHFERGMARAREDAGRYRRGGPAELSPEEVEELRALGYLGS